MNIWVENMTENRLVGMCYFVANYAQTILFQVYACFHLFSAQILFELLRMYNIFRRLFMQSYLLWFVLGILSGYSGFVCFIYTYSLRLQAGATEEALMNNMET